MRLRISLRGSVRLSVRLSTGFFSNLAVFERKKSSNDINDTISDARVVASDEPRRYLFPFVTFPLPLFTVFPFVRPSTSHVFSFSSSQIFVFAGSFGSSSLPQRPPTNESLFTRPD